MSKGVPTGKQLFSGKQAWLSPKDWTSGKIENNLTGDRDKDIEACWRAAVRSAYFVAQEQWSLSA